MTVSTLKSRRAACAVALLTCSLTSCFATIDATDVFEPTLVASGHKHVFGEPHAISQAMKFRLSGDSREVLIDTGGGYLHVRADYRRTGIYMGGLILPVLPLFGLFGDADDLLLGVHVGYDARLDVGVDDVSVHPSNTGAQPPIVSSYPYGPDDLYFRADEPLHLDPDIEWRAMSIAFDVTHASLDAFDIEVTVKVGESPPVDGTPHASMDIVRIHFDKRREVNWDTGFYGTRRYSQYRSRQ